MSEFNSTTNTIDNIVSTQLSSVMKWMSVAGNMVKVSESGSGFVWGFNSANQLYVCQVPCTGNWKEVDLKSQGVTAIFDLTTDLTNVYVLVRNSLETRLLICPVSQGPWISIQAPNVTKIFSTHTYIWAQDGTVKSKCAKPCSQGNWVRSPDISVEITGSDESSLYGLLDGEPVRTDENIATEWIPIGLSKFDKVVSKGEEGVYALKTSGNLVMFDGKTETPIDTNGQTPTNLTMEPLSKHLWITSNGSSDKGNIFSRLEKADYSSIRNLFVPLDKRRDVIADDISKDYKQQTDVMTLNKQVKVVVDFFSNIFKTHHKTTNDLENQEADLQNRIKQTQTNLDQINMIEPLLFKFILLLLLIVFVYIVGTPIIGSYVNLVSVLVLIGGTIYIIFK
jgi:hypothetical protein